jgi:hypothetical protein
MWWHWKRWLNERTKSFPTEDEIVEQVYGDLEPPDIIALLKIAEKSALIKYHHTTGRHIRNKYRLWELPEVDFYSEQHPDAISMRIIERVWERVWKEYGINVSLGREPGEDK